jgi:hypothetical protein
MASYLKVLDPVSHRLDGLEVLLSFIATFREKLFGLIDSLRRLEDHRAVARHVALCGNINDV